MANAAQGSPVRARREAIGWSQQSLADRCGLSRAAISAIETGRVDPSVGAALRLARALGCRVEDLFPAPAREGSADWAWEPRGGAARWWVARVCGRLRRYPAEALDVGEVPHDVGGPEAGAAQAAERTLVLAGCDPAVGVLAGLLLRAHGYRVLPYVRSSRRAIELLGAGLVHVAGVHLSERPGGNAQEIGTTLGGGPHRLVHVARWAEGIALGDGVGQATVRGAVRGGLRWVGREEGSGARRCLDEILEGRASPEGYERTASGHRGVAETIRSGWAQAGVCVQLVAEEAGLAFLPVRYEDYDLCYRQEDEGDPRIAALIETLRSAVFRRLLADLPGYDVGRTGDIVTVGSAGGGSP